MTSSNCEYRPLRLATAENPTTDALNSYLGSNQTGCLSIEDGKECFRVYVREGAIVGATASNDQFRLLHRLNLAKLLPIMRVKALETLLKQGASIFAALLDEVDTQALEKILFERYLDNLCSFVGSTETPKFEPLPAIFIDNLQLGHSAEGLIERSAELWEQASRLNLKAKLELGPRPPDNELQGLIFERLHKRARSVTSLVMNLPLEPIAARALLANMIRARMALVEGEPVSGNIRPEDSAAMESLEEIRSYAAQVDASIVAARSGSLSGPSVEVNDLKSWLESANAVSDEELGAFTDHDIHRGDLESGSFTAGERHLDRVDVKNVPPIQPAQLEEPRSPVDEPTEEIPKAAATISLNAPVLTPEESDAKLKVTNDILRTVSFAFDAIEGNGRGQEVTIDLIEAIPARFAVLFDEIGIHEDGTIERQSLMNNLRRRPLAEQRRLLNEGLLDLIERSLSLAADELPDETVDSILESVVGYRQRLGL